MDSADAGRNAESLNRQMLGLDAAGSKVSSMFGKMSALVGGISFAVLAKSMFSANSEAQKLTAQLASLTGGMANGSKAFDILNKFAMETPFSMAQVTAAFTTMIKKGIQPSQETMTAFGNIASAFGTDLSEVANAVGSATMGMYRGLMQLGVKAKAEGDGLSMTFQGVTTHIGKSTEEIVGYMNKIGNTKFGDAMRLQAATIPEKLEDVKEAVNLLWLELGKAGANTVFTDTLAKMAEWVLKLADAVKSGLVSDEIKIAINGFVQEFRSAFDELSMVFETFKAEQEGGGAFGFLAEMPMIVLDAFILLPSGIKMILTDIIAIADFTINSLINSWNQYDVFMSTLMVQIESAFATGWGAVKIGAGEAVDWVTDVWAEFIQSLGDAMPNFGPMAGWADSLHESAAALYSTASAADAARASMESLKGSYDKQIAAGNARIDELQAEAGQLEWNLMQEIAGSAKLLAAKRLELQAARLRAASLRDERDALGDLDDIQGVNIETTNQQTESVDEFVKKLMEGIKITGQAKTEEEKLGDAFFDLMGRLYPAVKAANEMNKMQKLVTDSAKMWGLSESAVAKILKDLPKLLDDAKKAEQDYEAVMLEGAKRLDSAFADMWSSFAGGGKLSFDSISGAFQQLYGELLQIAMRPITIQIETIVKDASARNSKMMKSMFGDTWGDAAGAGMMLLGQFGGSALGGGGKGANLGSSMGSMIGSLTPLGPIGGMIGGVLGGMLGGLFDDKPKYELSLGGTGAASKLGTISETKQTALGGFLVGHQNDVDPAALDQITKGIADFDKTMAMAMSPEQLGRATTAMAQWGIELTGANVSLQEFIESRFKQLLYMFPQTGSAIVGFIKQGVDFEEQVKRMTVALKAETLVKDRPELLVGSNINELLALVDLVSYAGQDITDTFDMIVGELLLAEQAFTVMRDFGTKDLFTEWQTIFEEGNRTLFEQTRAAGDNLSTLTASFDYTLTGATELAAAIQNRYDLEIQMLTEIANLADTLKARFASLQDMILTDISTPEQNTQRYWDDMNRLAEELKTAIDPADIDRITGEWDEALRKYWNSLSPEQQATTGPALMAWIGQVDLLAQQRIEAARQEVINQGIALRDQVDILMQGISGPLILVANEHHIAAQALYDAAIALGADPNAPSTPLPASSVVDTTQAADLINTSAITVDRAAKALTEEGFKYRDATSEMTGAVQLIVNSIPKNIPVDVDVNVNVDVNAPATVTTELV